MLEEYTKKFYTLSGLIVENFQTQREKYLKQGNDVKQVDLFLKFFRNIKDNFKNTRSLLDPEVVPNIPINRRYEIDAYNDFSDLKKIVIHVRSQIDTRDYEPDENYEIKVPHSYLVYEDDDFLIRQSGSEKMCIEFLSPFHYSWCVSSKFNNMYYSYRNKPYKPTFYFILIKDRTKAEVDSHTSKLSSTVIDIYHFFVLQVTNDGRYIVSSAKNDKDRTMSWEDILTIDPRLDKLKNLFVSDSFDQPQTESSMPDNLIITYPSMFCALSYGRKKEILNKNLEISTACFKCLPIDLKAFYIELGNPLTDSEFFIIKDNQSLLKRYEIMTNRHFGDKGALRYMNQLILFSTENFKKINPSSLNSYFKLGKIHEYFKQTILKKIIESDDFMFEDANIDTLIGNDKYLEQEMISKIYRKLINFISSGKNNSFYSQHRGIILKLVRVFKFNLNEIIDICLNSIDKIEWGWNGGGLLKGMYSIYYTDNEKLDEFFTSDFLNNIDDEDIRQLVWNSPKNSTTTYLIKLILLRRENLNSSGLKSTIRYIKGHLFLVNNFTDDEKYIILKKLEINENTLFLIQQLSNKDDLDWVTKQYLSNPDNPVTPEIAARLYGEDSDGELIKEIIKRTFKKHVKLGKGIIEELIYGIDIEKYPDLLYELIQNIIDSEYNFSDEKEEYEYENDKDTNPFIDALMDVLSDDMIPIVIKSILDFYNELSNPDIENIKSLAARSPKKDELYEFINSFKEQMKKHREERIARQKEAEEDRKRRYSEKNNLSLQEIFIKLSPHIYLS